VALCYCVLHYIAAWWSVHKCVVVCDSVWRCEVACGSVIQCEVVSGIV